MNRLYHFPLSPFSRKVRLSLAEKRIEVELVEERYWEQDSDFLRRNPAGKVPVLKMGHRTMADSTAICEYLEEMHERVFRKVMGTGYPDSSNVKTGARAVKFHLDYMAHLLDQRRWLAGNEMSLADFAAAAQLSCLDYISDVDWNRHAVVKDWYAKIKSRPAFRTLLADQISGFPQPAHYADLDF